MTRLDLGLAAAPVELRIFVPGRPESPNATRRRHWSSDAKKVAARRREVALLAIDARNRSGYADGFPIDRASIELVFVLVAARGDLDNLLAGSKPVLDGLVDARLLRTDSIAGVEEIVLRWRRGPVAGIEITVRERREEG